MSDNRNKFILGSILGFRGDDELSQASVTFEITEVDDSGIVEIAFNLPWSPKVRAYARLPLHEIVRMAITNGDPS